MLNYREIVFIFVCVLYVSSIDMYVSQVNPTGNSCLIGFPCGMAEAYAASANGDTIRILPGTYNEFEEIDVSTDVSFVGDSGDPSDVIFTGKSRFRSFNTYKIHFQDVTFKTNLSNPAIGAIYTSSVGLEEISAYRVHFIDVIDNVFDFRKAKSLNITDCLFQNVYSESYNYIYIENTDDFIIHNTEFVGDKVLGPIYTSFVKRLNISDVVVRDNLDHVYKVSASWDKIFEIGDTHSVDIKNLTFKNIIRHPGAIGSAIYMYDVENVLIHDSTFQNCSAIDIATNDYSSCVYIYEYTLPWDLNSVKITDSKFIDNFASLYVHDYGTILVDSCLFDTSGIQDILKDWDTSSSSWDGKLVDVEEFNYFTFSNNEVKGGACQVGYSDESFRGKVVELSNNKFSGCHQYVIHDSPTWRSSLAKLEKYYIHHDVYENSFHPLFYLEGLNDTEIRFEYTIFKYNHFEMYTTDSINGFSFKIGSGLVYLHTNRRHVQTDDEYTTQFRYCEFHHNKGWGSPVRIVYEYDDGHFDSKNQWMKVKLYKTKFYNNEVYAIDYSVSRDYSGSGGAISATGPYLYDYKDRDSLFKVLYCEFVSNIASFRGGAIHIFSRSNSIEVLQPKGYFELTRNSFKNNSAAYGADVFINGQNVDMWVNTFTGSRILERDGILYETGAVHVYKSDLGVIRNTFTDIQDGSGVFSQDTLNFVEENTFKNCSSRFWGGGMSLSSSAIDRNGGLEISKFLNNIVEDCSAVLGGGGFAIRYLYDSSPMSQVQLEFSTGTIGNYRNNTAAAGGALYLERVMALSRGRSNFQDNTAVLGGSIFLKNGMFEFEGNGQFVIDSSEASVAGGSIFDSGINSRKSINYINCTRNETYSCSQKTTEPGVSEWAYTNPSFEIVSNISMRNSKIGSGGFGKDFAGLPNTVRSIQDETSVVLNQVYSGEKFSIQMKIYDIFGNLVKKFPRFGESEAVEVYFEAEESSKDKAALQALTFRTQLDENSEEGILTFEGLSLSKKSTFIDQSLEVNLKIGVKLESEDYPRSNELIATVRIGKCPKGSRLTTSVISGMEVIGCTHCPENFYSLKENSDQCFECPKNGLCSNDGDAVVPEENYWAFLDDEGEMKMLYCSNGNCQGGKLSSSGGILNSCKGNHDPDEPLCSSCKKGYSEWNGNCVKCSNFTFLNVLVLMMFVCFVSYQIFTTHKNSQSLEGAIERIFSFFSQTYSFVLKNLQWGALGALLTPVLAIFAGYEIPVMTPTNPDVESSSYIIDLLIYPGSWVMSKIFVCPYSRSSYFILWTKLLEPFVFIGLILVLMLFTYFCCTCGCSIPKFLLCFFMQKDNKYRKAVKKKVFYKIKINEKKDEEEEEEEKDSDDSEEKKKDDDNDESIKEEEEEEIEDLKNTSSSSDDEENAEENEGGYDTVEVLGKDEEDDEIYDDVESKKEIITVQNKEEENEKEEEEELDGNDLALVLRANKYALKKANKEEDEEMKKNSPFEWWVKLFKEEKNMREYGPKKHPVIHGCNPCIGFSCTYCYAPCIKHLLIESEDRLTRESILKRLKKNIWSCLKLNEFRDCPKWIQIVCSPVILICSFPLFYMYSIAKWFHDTFLLSHAYRLTLVNMTIITYQMILENTMQYVLCMDYLGQSRNMVYSDIKCFDGPWWGQFSFLFLIPMIYCISYPCIIFTILFLNRNRLYSDNDKDNSFQKTFGILYLCYRKEVWWYEVAAIVRKFIVVALISLSSINAVVTNFLLSCTLLSFLLFHIYIHPYAKSFDNWLEGITLFCLGVLQLIRTSAFFAADGASLVAALILILVTFIPVYIVLLYLKYRLPLLFILGNIEKFFIKKCLFTCCIGCYPLSLFCRLYCTYCCQVDEYCCCKFLFFAPTLKKLRKQILDTGDEKTKLLDDQDDDEDFDNYDDDDDDSGYEKKTERNSDDDYELQTVVGVFEKQEEQEKKKNNNNQQEEEQEKKNDDDSEGDQGVEEDLVLEKMSSSSSSSSSSDNDEKEVEIKEMF